ncbi:RNA polymerase sigma factor [Silvibacterium sp.]|uniref:RNA polymerase sigma factor n=1 Tax=Silvibacterium sp. TaxID=1964179 RepID=UPI0039E57B6C
MSADEAEFEALVERHSRFVFRVAYALLRHREDAEDAAQETFLKLYRNDSWKGMEDERAFLARAAWRVAVDRMRGQRNVAERRHASLDEEDCGIAEPVSDDLSPEQLVMDADSLKAVQAMIDALPEELRQVLALSAVEEMNSREISEVLSVPEGTIRTRLMRARQLLKEKMAAKLERRKEGRYAR